MNINNNNNKLNTTLITLLLLYSGIGYSPVLQATGNISVESAAWQIEIDNDVFFKKDDKISSGWSLQKYSALAKSWKELEGVPDFVRTFGMVIPTLTKEGLYYRAGITLGQIIQTPTDLSRTDLIVDDVPYAGAATLQASWYAYNNDEFRGFEITTGIIGPLSLAGQMQSSVHQLTNNPSPNGWDNQLANEVLININYMRKQKIFELGNPAYLSFDMAVNANVALGNMVTEAAAAVEIRLGHNIPRGFVYVPDFIGFSMHHNAALKPVRSTMSFYSSLILRGSAYERNIFLDGNSFRDSHRVVKKPLVNQLIVGLHYERNNWAIHFNLMKSSQNVDVNISPAAERTEQVGTIGYEWRF